MSRTEKRIGLVWLSLFIVSVLASAGLTFRQGEEFPATNLSRIRHALKPNREARKIERASTLQDIETIRVQTSATNISFKRVDALNDMAVTLEGQFVKEATDPLQLEKSNRTLNVVVDEGDRRTPWRFAFDDENRNSSLSIALPRQFAGRLIIATVSGDTTLEALSLGELSWESVSGELQSTSGEIHIAHLKSVSGNIAFTGVTPDLDVRVTSADATLVLQDIERTLSAKLDAQSVSGRLDVTVPEASSLRISISSLTGEATSSIDLKKSMQSKGALEGQLGAGGGELRLRSVSGNVRLTTLKAAVQ
jgi:hypothetical protein